MATSANPQSPPTPWVVRAWRERGLISGGVATLEQLEELHADSWIVRRNRKSPHVVVGAPTAETGSWLARRNRHCGHSGAPRRKLEPPGAIDSWVRAKLPRAVQPLRAQPASVSPCTSFDSLSSCLSSGSSGDSLLGAMAGAGMPLSRLEASSEPGGAARPSVSLALYDLCTCCNGVAHRLGVGVYHSGIVVEGLEYTYASSHAPVVRCSPEPHNVGRVRLPRLLIGTAIALPAAGIRC